MPATSAAPTIASTAPSPPSSASPDLKAQLIRLDELPAFWVANPADNSSPEGPACLRQLQRLVEQGKPHAEVSFSLDHRVHAALVEHIGYFSSGAAAHFSQTVKAMDRCAGRLTATGSGTTLTGTLEPMPLPSFGDQSKAYQLVLSGDSQGERVTVGRDWLLLRVGDEEVTLFLTTGGTVPPIQDFARLVALAFDRIPSGRTRV